MDPNASGTVTATGTVVSFTAEAGEPWRIVLLPDASSAGLLGEGQQQLPCELPQSYGEYSGRFEAILSELPTV